MKTIKKVTALILSTVLLFSFVTTNVLAVESVDRYFYFYHPLDDCLTAHFRINNVEIDSYAEAYCTAYYAEDCDLGVKTYVTNQYYGMILSELYTTTAYVSLTVEFESGESGTFESAVQCGRCDYDTVVRAYGMRVVDVELDDTLTYFYSTHLVMDGYYVVDPLDNPECYPDEDIGPIYIELLD